MPRPAAVLGLPPATFGLVLLFVAATVNAARHHWALQTLKLQPSTGFPAGCTPKAVYIAPPVAQEGKHSGLSHMFLHFFPSWARKDNAANDNEEDTSARCWMYAPQRAEQRHCFKRSRVIPLWARRNGDVIFS